MARNISGWDGACPRYFTRSVRISCFLFIVHPKAGEKSSYPREFETCCLGSQDEVPVQCIVKVHVHRADGIPNTAAPEHCFLGNVARIVKRPLVVRRQDSSTSLVSLGINKNAVAIENVDIRPRLKEIGDIGKCARKKHIVTIEVRHDVAIGLREARVDGVRLPAVRCASPPDLIAVALQNLNGVVIRSPVLNTVK
jgi:hypothetical protein